VGDWARDDRRRGGADYWSDNTRGSGSRTATLSIGHAVSTARIAFNRGGCARNSGGHLDLSSGGDKAQCTGGRDARHSTGIRMSWIACVGCFSRCGRSGASWGSLDLTI
jgi:hypothetical protein